MKKVVIISSTPRRGGNSEVLAEEFARGAGDAGHAVEVIDLREYKNIKQQKKNFTKKACKSRKEKVKLKKANRN